MLSNAHMLRSPKLTVSLAALLAGSVTFNVFAVRSTNLEPLFTGTPNSTAASVQQPDALRLQQITDLQARIAVHSDTIARLDRERAVLIAKNAQTDQQLALTKQHLALTSQQLATSQQKLAATTEAARRVGHGTAVRVRSAIKRQFATAPSKLVPLLGNGVAIGSFGYDVYELCASMSDLADLNRAIGEPAGDDGVIETLCRTGKKVF